MVSDVAKAKEFYKKVFNWTYEDWSGPMPYTMIKPDKEPGGGIMKKPDEAPHFGLSVYFQVDDIDATLAKAKEAGGKVMIERQPIPDMGSWAMFMDPDGIPISIYEAKK